MFFLLHFSLASSILIHWFLLNANTDQENSHLKAGLGEAYQAFYDIFDIAFSFPFHSINLYLHVLHVCSFFVTCINLGKVMSTIPHLHGWQIWAHYMGWHINFPVTTDVQLFANSRVRWPERSGETWECSKIVVWIKPSLKRTFSLKIILW